jgi:hypothetical protein
MIAAIAGVINRYFVWLSKNWLSYGPGHESTP